MPASLLTVTPLTASGISHIVNNIPYSPVVWLDATRISGVTSNTSLSVWTDISASGSHASQPSAASQPLYVANVQNGLPVVRTNGTSSFLMFPQTLGATQPYSAFIALSSDSAANGHGLSENNTRSFFFIDNATTKYATFFGSTLLASAATKGQFLIWSNIVSGSSTTISVSGVTFSGAAGANGASGAWNIGCRTTPANFLAVDVGEIIIYERALSETERSSVQSYLAARWGVTLP